MRALDSAAVGTYRTRLIDGLRHLDAADGAGLQRLLSDVQPDVVFFPAAEPNVDWCELHAAEAYQANVVPAVAALRATKERSARFVFFSSDYVFDGERGPYVETDAVNPQSVYAQHKREIEERVLDAGQTVDDVADDGRTYDERVRTRSRSWKELRVARRGAARYR